MKTLQWSLVLIVLSIAMMAVSGCIFDEDSDDGVVAKTIDELAIGGVLFVIPGENLAQVQIGTFDGIDPFEDAVAYVNGVELVTLSGFHFNDAVMTSTGFPTGSTVRLAVYALGDSAVSTVVVPETPVIVSPAADDAPVVGEDLDVEITFPGAHQVISFNLTGQEPVNYAAETAETKATVSIPGTLLPNVIPSVLTAYSVNTSVESPGDVDISADRFNYFLVASIAARTIDFVSGQ